MFKTGIKIQRIVLALFIVLFLSSCVAKKKYIEMEGYKQRAEQRVMVLTKEIADLKEEFNQVNNQFYYNNSEKDAFIDSLNKVIADLNSDLSSSNESIEDKTFSFQVEKRRLNQMLSDKDREIRLLKRNNAVMEERADDLQKKINDLNIELQNSQSTASANERQISQKSREIERLSENIETQKSNLDKLKQEIDSKNEEIEALKNQVKLLKSQFGNSN